MKLINLFLIKKLTTYQVCKKGRFFPNFFLKSVLLMVWIWSRNRNRNFNLSKVGTKTVKNSNGSATLLYTGKRIFGFSPQKNKELNQEIIQKAEKIWMNWKLFVDFFTASDLYRIDPHWFSSSKSGSRSNEIDNKKGQFNLVWRRSLFKIRIRKDPHWFSSPGPDLYLIETTADPKQCFSTVAQNPINEQIFLSLGLHEGRLSYRISLSALKREHPELFPIFAGHFCPLDSDQAGQIRCGFIAKKKHTRMS